MRGLVAMADAPYLMAVDMFPTDVTVAVLGGLGLDGGGLDSLDPYVRGLVVIIDRLVIPDDNEVDTQVVVAELVGLITGIDDVGRCTEGALEPMVVIGHLMDDVDGGLLLFHIGMMLGFDLIYRGKLIS